MSGLAAAAAAAALISRPMVMPRQSPSKVKRKRSPKMADRSKKQYLLKGIRP
jgi:hypothetical protein